MDVSSTVGVVTLYTRTDAEETWGLGTLAVNLGGATLANYTDSDRAPFPAVCKLAGGRVLLGVLRFDEDDGASQTMVRLDTYHAPADADWSSSPFV